MTEKYRFTVCLETRSGKATLSRHRTYEAAERRADEHRKADAGKHPVFVQEHLAAPPRRIKVRLANKPGSTKLVPLERNPWLK
jgi:hypothetical protein